MLDKTPYTAIVLSGVEGDRFMDTVYRFADCRHTLCSILYIHQKGSDWFKKRVEKYPDVKWTIDSGGHSFRTEGFCPKWPDWNWFDDFANRYRDWLLENRDVIDLAVNLDVDCVDKSSSGTSGHGFEKMLEYDHEVFMPLERAGVPVCYVWHENYGFDYWLKLCREHEYVGLPGTLQSDAEYHKMMRPAMMNGCRVHGFACTKSSLLGKVPFASADSSVAGKSRLLLTKGDMAVVQRIDCLFEETVDRVQTTPTETVGYLPEPVLVHTVTDDLQPTFALVRSVVLHRVRKKVVRIVLESGKAVEGTSDHSFFTLDEDGRLLETSPDSLSVGDQMVAGCGHVGCLPHYATSYERIASLETVSEDEEVLVYDLSVEKYERFFAEGILAHNTTWKSGERFGQTFVFESSKLNVYDHNNKEVRQRYKAQWVAKGVDWDLLEQDKAEAISQVAAIAWGQLQEHITTLSGKLAYWNKTSRLADDLGDPEKTDPTAVNKLMEDVGCPIRVDNQSDAVGCLEELQWILGRHPEVMSMPDDNLDWWIEQIQAEPENTTRVEKEACIRQRLYEWFYKINASEAKSRTKDDVTPVLELKPRVVPPPDVEDEVPELPDSPSVPTSETTAERTSEATVEHAMESTVNQDTEYSIEEAQVSADTGFIDSAPDRIQRSRATLALDLLFEQFKLRHEADLLKRLRVRKKRMQECRRQANAMASEITSHTDSLDPPLAEKVRDAAQEMFDQWISLQQNEEAEHLRQQREVLAQRPQNRALATRASEIGRLGGAPKGNQNARKHGLSSKKMPSLACDNCPHIQVCPQYRAGHVCAFIGEFEAPLVAEEDEEPQVAAVRQILEAQVKRARRALLYETFEGGIINKQTSTVLQSAMSAAKMYHDMKHPPDRSPFGAGHHSAPEEDPKGGFLTNLFSDLAHLSAKDVESTPVDTESENG